MSWGREQGKPPPMVGSPGKGNLGPTLSWGGDHCSRGAVTDSLLLAGTLDVLHWLLPPAPFA